MAIKIDSNIIIGNALIYIKQQYISKNTIYQFWHMVDDLLPIGYYTYGDNNSFEDFCERYKFLINRNGDKITIDEYVYESGILARYFCFAIPKEITKIFKKVALNFLELEKIDDNYFKKIKKVEK